MLIIHAYEDVFTCTSLVANSVRSQKFWPSRLEHLDDLPHCGPLSCTRKLCCGRTSGTNACRSPDGIPPLK